MKGRLLGTLLVSLLSLPACLGSADASDVNPVEDSVRIDGASDSIALPSATANDFVNEGLAWVRTLGSVEVNACMDSKGFSYRVDNRQVAPAGDEMRYGLDDPIAAKNFGYRSPIIEEPSPEQHEGAAYLLALNGAPDDPKSASVQTTGGLLTHTAPAGCWGQALETMFGSRQIYLDTLVAMSLVEDFGNRSLAALTASDTYAEVTASWAECMEAGGEATFRTPYDAMSATFESPEVERRVAGLDVRCKQEVGLPLQFRQFEWDWQQDNLIDIDGYLERLSDSLADLRRLGKEGD